MQRCTIFAQLRAVLVRLAKLMTAVLVRLATDTFIQKTKKLYLDTRTQRNIAKLSEDLNEVHSIMTRNIAEVLGQGERLDSARLLSHFFQRLSEHVQL